MNENNKLEEFEKLLKAHDWYYHFSDDARWYNAGAASSNHISRMKAEFTGENAVKAQELYNKYAPKSY